MVKQAGQDNGKTLLYLRKSLKVEALSIGLSLAYYIEEEEYLDFTQKAGMRVVIHGQNETVLPDNFGFDVASGYRSTVAISQVCNLLIM